MSKSNDTWIRIEDVEASTLDLGGAATFTVRELRDDELQKVTGGLKADSNEVAVEGFVSCALGVAGGAGFLDIGISRVGPSRRV